MHRIIPLLLLAAFCGTPAWAYEEMAVSDGGTVLGTVKLEGHVPKPKGYNLTTLPDQIYCGRISDGHGWRLLQPFNVGPAGEFRDLVVYLEGIEKGKSFVSTFASPRIEARDCRFMPFTTIVREKENVVVVNMDPVMHDIQAYESSQLGARVLFNVPLPMNPQHPRDLKDRSEAALYTVFTLGGLHTDVDGRVLSPDGVPVPGLFAAGRTTSGLAAQGYSSGLSIADATFFGRRAGRAAAAA